MQRSVPMLGALVAVALIAPVGSATWSAFGAFEPDNALDSEQYMFFDPAPAGTKRVYFAAFATTGSLVNTNVAALATSIEQVTVENNAALFGVWIDCNADGYVGMAESALYEYDAALLLDDSVCPRASGSANNWPAGAHNYNDWVTEFVPIGGIDPDAEDDARDRRIYRDPEAMVWGDSGRPTDGAEAGGSCALFPLPRGTLASTGGLLNYLSCSPGIMDRWNEIILGRDVMGLPFGGVDPSNSLGLAFGTNPVGEPDARGHPIFDKQTLGSEDSSGAAVTVVDCGAEPAFHSGDFFNDTPLGPSVPAAFQNESIVAIDPQPTGTANPTIGGQNNQTTEEFLDDCDTSNDAGHDTYGLLEDDFNSVSSARKTEADWNLQFEDSPRGSPFGLLMGANGDAGTSYFGGISAAQAVARFALIDIFLEDAGPSMWYSNNLLVKYGPQSAGVNTYSGDAVIDPAYYLTFYAHAGAATKARGFAFPGGVGAYGSAQCGENDSGVHNGWECDPSEWYVNPDGTFVPEPYPFARPGQQYEFRDVDCYDGAIGDTGVGAGAPFYGAEPCP